MTLDAWIALAVVAMVIGLLVFTRFAADVVLVAGVTLLLITGVISPQEALAGLSNEGMVTVAVLYVIAAGLRETGAVAWLVQWVLGRPRNLLHAQLRLMAPVAAVSGFLNNTPLVAMLMPAVKEWARRNRLRFEADDPLELCGGTRWQLHADRHQHQPGGEGHAHSAEPETDGWGCST